MLKISKNGVTFETILNQGNLMFLLAWFVDKTLLDIMLQCEAIL